MLNKLSDSASIWIFQSDALLKEEDKKIIQNKLGEFIPGWAAHGVDLKADFDILHDYFVVVGVDERQAGASGCSKDSLTKEIQIIGNDLRIDFFNRLNIAHRNENGIIEISPLATIKEGLNTGSIQGHTVIFNNLVQLKSELKTEWEIYLKNSWLNTFNKVI